MEDPLIHARSRLLDRRAVVSRQQLTDRASNELQEIDCALARIEAHTYGCCERCGGAIGRQRLQAVPEARRCIRCAA